MSADTAAVETRSKPDVGGKQKLLSLDDMDGRTRAAQMVRATIDSLTTDLGSDLSTAETMIVRRAAVAGAMAEDLAVRWLTGEAIDPGTFSALSNNERRLLETVGLKRIPRNVSGSLRDDILRTKGQSQ